MCPSTTSAIQTLTSGKQIIEMEAGQVNYLALLHADNRQFERPSSGNRSNPTLLVSRSTASTINCLIMVPRSAAMALARRKTPSGKSTVIRMSGD
jgi:hypothetical protein